MSVAVLTRQRPRAALSVWLYDAALALAGAAWFVLVVARLPQHEEQARVPLLAMIAFFCAAESFRVYVHFRRNAQSFSLSELALVSPIARSAVELFLLVTPLGALAAAYALYTREHHKRTQLQHLYQSSDLLQRASADRSAIPELLAQLCEVFRAEVATVTLLPVASGTESLTRITLRRGECVERQETVSTEMLEHFTPILDEHQRAMLAVRGDSEPRRHTWP